ncbi:hypothetical protein ABZ023_18700 [Streptomyces sp. NPDC006367]|uniref:hypothetical protein n=1 Tax=unclassified Streptomyces TaxID=2593676 RepID=UPI0033B348F9
MSDDGLIVYVLPDKEETRSPLEAAQWWLAADRPSGPAPTLVAEIRSAGTDASLTMLADPRSLLAMARAEAGIAPCTDCMGSGGHAAHNDVVPTGEGPNDQAEDPCTGCGGQGYTGPAPADHPLFIAEAGWLLARLPGSEVPDAGHWQRAARAWMRLAQPALQPSVGRARAHAGNWEASQAFRGELQALAMAKTVPTAISAARGHEHLLADWAVVQAAAPHDTEAAAQAAVLLRELTEQLFPAAAAESAGSLRLPETNPRLTTALTICALANPSTGAAEAAEILRRATDPTRTTGRTAGSAVLDAVLPALDPATAPGQNSASAMLDRLAETTAAAIRAHGSSSHPRLLREQDRAAEALRNALLGSAAVLLSRERSHQITEQATATDMRRPTAQAPRHEPPAPGMPGPGRRTPGR